MQTLSQDALLNMPVSEALQHFESRYGSDAGCGFDVSADVEQQSVFLRCLGLALHAKAGNISPEDCSNRLASLGCPKFFEPQSHYKEPPHQISFREDTVLYDRSDRSLEVKAGAVLRCLVIYCDSRYLDVIYAGRTFPHVPRAGLRHLDCPECQT